MSMENQKKKPPPRHKRPERRKEGKDYRTLERKNLVRSSLGLLNTS